MLWAQVFKRTFIHVISKLKSFLNEGFYTRATKQLVMTFGPGKLVLKPYGDINRVLAVGCLQIRIQEMLYGDLSSLLHELQGCLADIIPFNLMCLNVSHASLNIIAREIQFLHAVIDVPA